tara:strand:+ start:3922 stop:4224 length:303 start_codon:yes stop_codon:yes gene_type:complete
MAKTAVKKTAVKKVSTPVVEETKPAPEPVKEVVEKVVVESKTREYTHGPFQGHDPDGIYESVQQYITENQIPVVRIIDRTIGYNNETSCYEGWITYEITE